LRKWLNSAFLNSAFTEKERSAILTTHVNNDRSQSYSGWNKSGGKNTKDQIFLLSYAEANQYLNVTYDDNQNLESRVAPTRYAIHNGAYTSDSNRTEEGLAAGWWWLRSPGSTRDSAADVINDGSLDDVNNGGVVVRPALWLDLESDFI